MSAMRPEDYEKLVADLAESVASRVANLPGGAVRYGWRNRWPGASGHRHQIDVSIKAHDLALFVECKCWKGVVPVEAVLVLVARLHDIRPTLAMRVEGAIISAVGFTSGARQVGQHFGIHCDVVKSAEEFAFKYHTLLVVQPRAASTSSSTTIGTVLITGPSR